MKTRLFRELTAALMCALMLLQSATAAAPGWWSAQGVIASNKPADDYAALNQGQLKLLASKAWLHMELGLPGGAGPELTQMISGWRLVKPQTDDFAVVNVGQLKTVARPFYERLAGAGLLAPPGWIGQAGAANADDFGVVNLGQAKLIFSFALPQAINAAPQRLSGNGMSGAGSLPSNYNWGSGPPPMGGAAGLTPPGMLPGSDAEVSTHPAGAADWGVLRESAPVLEWRHAGGSVGKAVKFRWEDHGTSNPNDDEYVRDGWEWGGWADGGGPGDNHQAREVTSTGGLGSTLDELTTLALEPEKNFSSFPEPWPILQSSYYKTMSLLEPDEIDGELWSGSQMQLRLSGGGVTDAPGQAWWQVHRIIRNEDGQIIEHTTEFLPVVIKPSREEAETVTVTSRHWDTPGESEEVWVKLVKPAYIQVNDGDADGDEVPDHADGQEETYPDPEDEPDLPQTAPLRSLPGVFGNAATRVRYHLEGENLRLWRQELFKSHQVNRDPRLVVAGGDLVPWDEWLEVVDLGQVFVESLAPSEEMHDQVVTMEVDYDGDGPEPPMVYDRTYFTSVGTFLERVENGHIGARDMRLRPSLPNPTIDLQNVSVTNPRVAADGSGLLVDVAFSGTVRSAVCDLTPGEETGAIQHAYASVNSEPLPQSVVSLQVTKGDTPAGQDRPYPYQGTFNHTLTGVKVMEGKNTLGLLVSDPLYHLSGTAEVGFEIDATPPGGAGGAHASETAVTLHLPVAGSTLAADEARLSVETQDATLVNGVILKRQAGNALLYRSMDGQAAFQFTQAPSLTTTAPEALHGFITLPQSGWQGAAFSPLTETEVNSGVFVWSAAEHYAGYWGWSVSVGPVGGAVESGPGEFHAYTVRLQGPEELLEQVRHIHIAGQALPVLIQNGIARVADALHPDRVLTVASLPTNAVQPPEPPEDQSISQELGDLGQDATWEEQDIPEELHDAYEAAMSRRLAQVGDGAEFMRRIERQITTSIKDHFTPSFYGGFVVGFLDNPWSTGKDCCSTLLGLGTKAAQVAWMTSPLGMMWEFSFGDCYQGEIKAAVNTGKKVSTAVNGAYQFAKEWGEPVCNFLQALMNQSADAVGKALRGEIPQREKMGPELQVALEVITHLIMMADDAWTGMSAYKRGYWQGYIAFEVVAVVAAAILSAPAGGSGGAAVAARHVPKLTRIFSYLEELLGRFDDVPGIKKLADRIREFITGANAAGSFCFVAGTLVLTMRGQIPIEQVKAGDYVWSRDDETGEWGWRPVVKTFVTHPDTLVHVRYEAQGGAVVVAASEGLGLMRQAVQRTSTEVEIVGTEGHPFHVRRTGVVAAFLAASALQAGDLLTLADGRDAVVKTVQVEQAAEDRLFTTYNFTVADHHTYFAGALPVWVHNTGLADCDFLFKFYETCRKHFNKSSAETWREIVKWHDGSPVRVAGIGIGQRRCSQRALGNALEKSLLRDEFPGRNTPLWSTDGRPPAENMYGHFFKHVHNPSWGDMKQFVDNPVDYVKRAHQWGDKTASIDGELEVWEGVKERFGGVLVRERWVFNKSTKEFTMKILSGSESGAVRSLYVLSAGESSFIGKVLNEGFTRK